MASPFKPGMRVTVPWGLAHDREGIVVEVWGDPSSPSHVRVQLLAKGDEEPAVLLLAPTVVTPAQVA